MLTTEQRKRLIAASSGIGKGDQFNRLPEVTQRDIVANIDRVTDQLRVESPDKFIWERR